MVGGVQRGDAVGADSNPSDVGSAAEAAGPSDERVVVPVVAGGAAKLLPPESNPGSVWVMLSRPISAETQALLTEQMADAAVKTLIIR